MKYNLKALLITVPIVFFGLSAHNVTAQEAKKPTETAGCKPSSCRGAKTKFGEAKVITELRESLIAVKATMEKSESPAFDKRSFDIEGIVGESDEESLSIIAREVKIMEGELSGKLNRQFDEFELPGSKAQQVKYLSGRIQDLESLL